MSSKAEDLGIFIILVMGLAYGYIMFFAGEGVGKKEGYEKCLLDHGIATITTEVIIVPEKEKK